MSRLSPYLRIHCTSLLLISLVLSGCLSTLEPLGEVSNSQVTVKMDFLHRPLPEIPLPNDIATRFDPSSPTHRRINASMIASTKLESRVRALIDELDGWGVNQPITIPFTGAIDPRSILERHRDSLSNKNNLDNDVIFLINVTRGEHYGELVHLDVGSGNYPVVLEQMDGYWEHDPRSWTNSIVFEEADEDLDQDGILGLGEDINGNGQLDEGEDLNGDGILNPPEDLDGDGVLDRPNYLPCGLTGLEDITCDEAGLWLAPDREKLAQRADALMTFYERETDTLIVRAMEALRERSTYAVILTRRILAEDGSPIGSPFESYHHLSQKEALEGVSDLLPDSLSEADIAFAFTFTTQSLGSQFVAVREGLYGKGIQQAIGQSETYQPRLASLETLRDLASGRFEEDTNPYIMYTKDWIQPFSLIAQQLLGQDPSSREYEVQFEAQNAVDYHVIGSFVAPQLFARTPVGVDPKDISQWLPFNEQSWPQNLDTVPLNVDTEVSPEQIWFWLMMPSEEKRGPGPVPLVIVGHGYGSNRFESLAFAGYLAEHGLASIAIDCPSHGLGLDPSETEVATTLTGVYGISGFLKAASKGRAFDQDFDEAPDSGADYWTSYVFHTRDVVRQCVLDHMQLIRLIRSFDGQRRWERDLNGDGEAELAGDFNADGVVDIGVNSPISILGASLGGIISSMVASLEPEITAAVPISGGGGLGDIGVRSIQGGVREAVILRVMGPVIIGEADEEGTRVYALMPELNDDGRRNLGRLPSLTQYDSLLLENLDNGETACAYVQEDGSFRVHVDGDKGDRIVLSAFKGPQIKWSDDEPHYCSKRNPETKAVAVLDRFGETIEFLGEEFKQNSPLRTLSEGFGEKRASPGMRRFLSLGQLVLDGGDPASYARHLLKEPLYYPRLEQHSGAHALIVTTMGDMNVPASSGATLGRSAGLIDYLTELPDHGKSANEVLLDTYSIEAVHSLKRNTDANGNGVHVDIELFSSQDGQSADVWSAIDVPRLNTPLRSGLSEDDELGGRSGAIFPYSSPEGQHGFNFPGVDQDIYIERCRSKCAEDNESCLDNCSSDYIGKFDVGLFFFNLIGEYIKQDGKVWEVKACYGDDSCDQ